MHRSSAIMRMFRFVIAPWICVPIVQGGQPNTSDVDEPRNAAESRRDALEAFRSSLEFGRSWLKDRPDNEFVACEFAEFGGGAALDLFWIIKDDARPRVRKHPKYPVELEPGVELEVRAAAAQTPQQNDLVEFRWQLQGRPIRVVASANAFKIDFDLRQLSSCSGGVRGGACIGEARTWVERVLKLEGEQRAVNRPIGYRVELPWPDSLSDGVRFCSSPEQNIMRLRGWPQWFDRVDAFVENEVLSFLIYRSIGQRMTSFRDGSKWFPEDFRKQILSKAKE